MKSTLNGITFEVKTSYKEAPADSNGNKRIDIEVLINGKPLRDTVKGYRKVKNGYRVQLGSHAYSAGQAQKDLVETIIHQLKDKEEYAKKPSSTHKLVTDQIQGYILDNLSDDNSEHVMDKLEDVVEDFINWYGEYERRRTPNVQAAFKEWLQGLPSALYVTPYYEEMRELMNKWLGTTDKNYSDDVIAHRFHAVIFREYNKLCSSNGVESIYKRL